MSADKMFEELGFRKLLDGETDILYVYDKRLMGDRILHHILFSRVSKIIFSYGDDTDKTCGIGMQELKAINKKCEELGWI